MRPQVEESNVTHRVFVADPIHEDAVEMLRQKTEVVLGYGPNASSLHAEMDGMEAILLRNSILTADEIESAPALRVIARHGVGVDNVAVETASIRGLPVVVTPKANLRSVAEHVFCMALAVSRNLVRSDRTVRAGGFRQRDELTGQELFGKQIGIVGMGRIGREVARLAIQGFGMRALGYDPWLSAREIRAEGVKPFETLAEMLPECDLLTLHVPVTDDTWHLLGSEELRAMRPASILIQTARGGVVDEDALVDTLRSGHLSGAGIDVYEAEPPPEDHPFFSMEQVILTPHTAAHTEQAMLRMATDAACGILDILGGADPLNPPAESTWQTINREEISRV